MNDNLTIKSGVFNLLYKDKAGSLRKAAPGTPFSTGAQGSLSIAHQSYTDSVTKKTGRRSVLRFQIEKANAAGEPVISYAQLIVSSSLLRLRMQLVWPLAANLPSLVSSNIHSSLYRHNSKQDHAYANNSIL